MSESTDSSNPRANATKKITILELGHNSSGMGCAERHVNVSQYERLLLDAGQVMLLVQITHQTGFGC